MTPEEVDAIAQGRVWTGAQALDHGLVDNLGHLQDAINSAAALAELGSFGVRYLEPPASPKDMLLRILFDDLAPDLPGIRLSGPSPPASRKTCGSWTRLRTRNTCTRCASCAGGFARGDVATIACPQLLLFFAGRHCLVQKRGRVVS